MVVVVVVVVVMAAAAAATAAAAVGIQCRNAAIRSLYPSRRTARDTLLAFNPFSSKPPSSLVSYLWFYVLFLLPLFSLPSNVCWLPRCNCT